MIEKADLAEMFANICAKTDWDMTGPMRWGYFFTNSTREPLDRAIPRLVAAGYRFIDLYPQEPEEDAGEETWWLHVERDEIHSVDSLFARNAELYEFAETHAIDSYDGMDVGPTTGSGDDA